MPAAYKLYSRLQSFYGNSGELLAGGTLNFCTAGTLTAKDVYGEEALTTNNGSTVTLDASGRPNLAIWGSGEYDVYLKDSDGAAAGEDLNVKIPGGDATVLPVLQSGEFLSGDGSGNYIAVDLSGSLLPDQTGHSNGILGTDGGNASWVARPADGAAGASADIDVLSDGLRIGDIGTPTTSFRIVKGTGTIAASGAHTASGSLSFGVTFLSAPTVELQATGGGVTGDGYLPILSASSITTTGCNVTANINEGGTTGGTNISSTVNYSFVAIGQMTTP
jgi:hypothetical protein